MPRRERHIYDYCSLGALKLGSGCRIIEKNRYTKELNAKQILNKLPEKTKEQVLNVKMQNRPINSTIFSRRNNPLRRAYLGEEVITALFYAFIKCKTLFSLSTSNLKCSFQDNGRVFCFGSCHVVVTECIYFGNDNFRNKTRIWIWRINERFKRYIPFGLWIYSFAGDRCFKKMTHLLL